MACSEVDCGFKSGLGSNKDYKIGICCCSAKYTALTSKSKDWSAQNQDNELSNMSTPDCCFSELAQKSNL